jgi:chemotaxis protein methyltransferase CheR
LKDCGAYAALLKNRDAGESERHFLIGQLTIGETYSFRHTEQFDAIRDVVLPDVIARNKNRRTLRIWSAGCALGAEPYSVGILLRRHFADRLAGWDVGILGTDIFNWDVIQRILGHFHECLVERLINDCQLSLIFERIRKQHRKQSLVGASRLHGCDVPFLFGVESAHQQFIRRDR